MLLIKEYYSIKFPDLHDNISKQKNVRSVLTDISFEMYLLMT
jgi:hypothetical protein